MKLSFFVYLILFVGGCYVSELLVDLHIQAHLGGPDSGLCAAGAGFSCVDVATSSFSSIFGIPIASIGLAFYLAGIVLVCIAYFLPKLIEGLPDVFLAGGVLATVYSVFLGIASSFVIGKICPLCLVHRLLRLSTFKHRGRRVASSAGLAIAGVTSHNFAASNAP